MTGDILPEVGAQPGVRALEKRWPEPAPSSGGRCAPTSRYRGSVLAELARRSAPILVVGAGSRMRALAALEVIQADARELPLRPRAGCRPGNPASTPRHDRTSPGKPCRTNPWLACHGMIGGVGNNRFPEAKGWPP